MKFTLTGRKIEVTPAMKEYTEKKLGKLDKFFHDDAEAKVTFTSQRDKMVVVEATIHSGGMIFRAEDAKAEPNAAIDRLVDIIERQIRKNKTRLEKRLKEKAFITAHNWESGETISEEKDFSIVRTKTYNLKPMSPEEAILQMNLLGHNFFVFKDHKTNGTSIVYSRKEGTYGLIETNRD